MSEDPLPPSHIGCSVLEDLADGGSPSKTLTIQLAYALAAARFDSPFVIASSVPFRIAQTPRLDPAAVPLNVRHCVFLI
jgi:hypothetical protein